MKKYNLAMRWFSVLSLLAIFILGPVAAGMAQEPGSGTPVTVPAADSTGQMSIGENAPSSIAIDIPDAAEVPATDEPSNDLPIVLDESVDGTPISGGIGGDETTDIPLGDDPPVAGEIATDTPGTEATPSLTETVEAEDDQESEPVLVPVSVTVFLCDIGYGGGDPTADTNCQVADGIDVAASANGVPFGTQTTAGGGLASFQVPEGAQVIFAESKSGLPAGYVPNGDGSALLTATSGASAAIVNIEVQTTGHLQITSGQCPTSGDPRTDFIVVGPLAVQGAATGCGAMGGMALTVSGSGGTYSIVTDGSGNWVGTIPSGEYTISSANGSAVLQVEINSTTVVVVVDYVPGPKGTLTIERFACNVGVEGTTIAIGGGPNDPSCIASNQRVFVTSLSGTADPLSIDLGDDGTTSIDMASGHYLVTDGLSGASIEVPLDEGSVVTVSINSTVLTGAVAASFFWCDGVVSNSVTPSTWGNWANKCGRISGGVSVSLLDDDGNVVSTAVTGNGGSLSFSSLMPGTYRIDAPADCAIFADGADARNGFQIVAGNTVELAAFSCDDTVDQPEQSGGSTGGGDSTPGEQSSDPTTNIDRSPDSIGSGEGTASGGNNLVGGQANFSFASRVLADPTYHTRNLTSNPVASVSTLPSTGEGDTSSSLELLMLTALGVFVAGVAASLSSGNRKQR